MEKKICSKCKEEKELCDFGVCNSNKDGLKSTCKVCRKIEGKIYRENNAGKREETIKNWYNKNPEYNRNYYINNTELINKQNKKWYENNKEKHRENDRIRKEKNIESVREYHNNLIKHQRKADPLKKLIFNVRSRVYNILKNKIITKSNKTFDIVGCSPEFLKEHLEKQFTKGMSWDNQGKWHIDHKIPLSSAKTEEEIYKLCHYSNLQPLWAEDNLKKGCKILN
jgi:hypothetical protein